MTNATTNDDRNSTTALRRDVPASGVSGNTRFLRVHGDFCLVPCLQHRRCNESRRDVAKAIDVYGMPSSDTLRNNGCLIRMPGTTGRWVYVFTCQYSALGRYAQAQRLLHDATGYRVVSCRDYLERTGVRIHPWRKTRRSIQPFMSSPNHYRYYWQRELLADLSRSVDRTPERCAHCGKRTTKNGSPTGHILCIRKYYRLQREEQRKWQQLRNVKRMLSQLRKALKDPQYREALASLRKVYVRTKTSRPR